NSYGFSSQKLQAAKKSYEDLEETRATFSLEFWDKYKGYEGGGILNVHETVILFDMPPIKWWAGKGRKDSARILDANKHAGRMTAVLTVRDDDSPSVLLVDNFDCHMSDESQRLVAEVANATVVPLPPNSTAVCQLLDVGVMGPLKAKIRNSGSRSTGGTATEKRIRAIESTVAAWKSIKTKTVIRSFKKAIPKYPEVTV
ncbi:hypothetical protein JG688_00011321, partial [Phytophthora aleatoria]